MKMPVTACVGISRAPPPRTVVLLMDSCGCVSLWGPLRGPACNYHPLVLFKPSGVTAVTEPDRTSLCGVPKRRQLAFFLSLPSETITPVLRLSSQWGNLTVLLLVGFNLSLSLLALELKPACKGERGGGGIGLCHHPHRPSRGDISPGSTA